MESSSQEPKNCTNNFTNNSLLINSFRNTNNISQNIPNAIPIMPQKPNFSYPYMINPVIFNNPNFKQMYPQMYQNINMANNTNNINNNQNTNNTNGNTIKMPVMGIPVLVSPLMFSAQDQTPVLERSKIWIGKIKQSKSHSYYFPTLSSEQVQKQ